MEMIDMIPIEESHFDKGADNLAAASTKFLVKGKTVEKVMEEHFDIPPSDNPDRDAQLIFLGTFLMITHNPHFYIRKVLKSMNHEK